MLINPKEHGMNEEQCQETKKVVSKYGISVVCNEEEELKEKADIVMSAGEGCEEIKTTVGKYGVSVLCEE
jgi:hypothetical protein